MIVARKTLSQTILFLSILALMQAQVQAAVEDCPDCSSTHHIWALDYTETIRLNLSENKLRPWDKMMAMMRNVYWTSDRITIFGWGIQWYVKPFPRRTKKTPKMRHFAAYEPTNTFDIDKVVASPPGDFRSNLNEAMKQMETQLKIGRKDKTTILWLTDGA